MSVNVKKFKMKSKQLKLIVKRSEKIQKAFWDNRKFLGLALAVFFIGLFSGYTANAAVTPTQEDWDAYAQLKPVKKMNYDKVYESIEADVNRLTVKEEQFAVNLPLQLEGPMNAMEGKKRRTKRAKKVRKNSRYR